MGAGEDLGTSTLPNSSEKICLTPCRRQDFVQDFISGSSMILRPCCIRTHTGAHLFSSTAWHMQRQHQPPGSYLGTRAVAPVTDNKAKTTIADVSLFFTDISADRRRTIEQRR